MKTLILKINPKKPSIARIKKAARFIRNGELVVFPTETVYGLGADALNRNAVKKIFEAKGRPQDNPIIVHIYSVRQLHKLAKKIPKSAMLLSKKFWPGPLTMILPKRNVVPDEVTAGLKTVAIRMPSHRIARLLCKYAGVPIAAPSANISGRPSATCAAHAIRDFKEKVACIIDGGSTNIGVESTVVDLTSKRPTILRPGGITAEQIKEILPKIKVHAVARAKKMVTVARSPGTKYRHYAPEAKLILVEGKKEMAIKEAVRTARGYLKKGKKTALLLLGSDKKVKTKGLKIIWLRKKEDIARNLFAALRMLDSIGVEVIVANAIDERGLGLAIMNRLRKASSAQKKLQ